MIRQRLDTPLTVMLIVALLYAAFLLARLRRTGYDFTAFITAGDVFVDASATPSRITVLPGSDGYDGQFYYRLALDPFTAEQTAYGVRIDTPAYRQQRILYPLLAALLSLGRSSLVPLALIGVNYLALCGIAWLGGHVARGLGVHALWGAALALFPGFLLSLSRDTTEIVAGFFLLAYILSISRGKPYAAGLALSLAVLGKETALIAAAGLFLSLLPARSWPALRGRLRANWFTIAAPVVVYILWQAWLSGNWGIASVSNHTFTTTIGWPFGGIADLLRRIVPPEGRVEQVWLLEMALIGLFAAVCLAALWRSRAALFVKVTWLLYLGLAVLLTATVWADDWAFLRVLSELYIFGVVILLGSRPALRQWALAAVFLSWALLAWDVVLKR
jgi:hypothetical protein